jgi:hypothetical protein
MKASAVSAFSLKLQHADMQEAKSAGPKSWMEDSGATHHFCGDKTRFKGGKYTKFEPALTVTVADGHKAEVLGYGTVQGETEQGDKITFRALYGPSLMNVISGTRLHDHGFTSSGDDRGVSYKREDAALHFDRRGGSNYIDINTNVEWASEDEDDAQEQLKASYSVQLHTVPPVEEDEEDAELGTKGLGDASSLMNKKRKADSTQNSRSWSHLMTARKTNRMSARSTPIRSGEKRSKKRWTAWKQRAHLSECGSKN